MTWTIYKENIHLQQLLEGKAQLPISIEKITPKKLRNQNNQTNKDKIELKTTLLPIHKDLNAVIRNALKQAEARYLREHPHIQTSIYNAQQAKLRMETGDPQGAGEIQKKDLETKKLIEHGN